MFRGLFQIAEETIHLEHSEIQYTGSPSKFIGIVSALHSNSTFTSCSLKYAFDTKLAIIAPFIVSIV